MSQIVSSNSEKIPYLQEKPDQFAETAYETVRKDNLAILVNNIKIYCSMLVQGGLDQFILSKYKYLVQSQLSDVWFRQPLKDFRLQVENPRTFIESFQLYENLDKFEEICRQLSKMKDEAQDQATYQKAQTIINGFFKELQSYIINPEITINRLEKFDVYGNTIQEADQQDMEAIEKHHFQGKYLGKELIDTEINYEMPVFTWVKPPLHKVYISQTAKSYHQIVPIRIKNILPNSPENPTINVKNYFAEGTDETKAIIATCIPGTNRVGFYAMADICKLLSMERQYYQERVLTNQWNFTKAVKSIVTPQGKMFAINARTTEDKIDSYLFEITETKASNRGPLPTPRRDCSIIYLNRNIYVIGGRADLEKCSNKNYRYSIKDKKWYPVAQSNVALRKPTLCTLNDRYLLKIGGLNQFNYINKVIQIYDSKTNKWSLVRATPKNITQEIQVLEDSMAVQINDDQVFVFGGKNSNGYNVDKGFLLQITEIRQRRKGASKVTGDLWNMSVGKRNILTLFGSVNPNSVLIHYNCIYALRVNYTEALAI